MSIDVKLQSGEFNSENYTRNQLACFLFRKAQLSDVETATSLLQKLSPEETIAVVSAEPFPVHKFLSIFCADIVNRVEKTPAWQQRKEYVAENLLERILPHCMPTILTVQDDEENTLLHYLIYLNLENLSFKLINMGAPIHLKNDSDASPFEAALQVKNLSLATTIARMGGTTHYLVRNYCTDSYADVFKYAKSWNLLKPMVNFYKELAELVKSTRKDFIGDSIQELERGPMITFSLFNFNGKNEIQYVETNLRFKNRAKELIILSIFPVVWIHGLNVFQVYRTKGVQNLSAPTVNGSPLEELFYGQEYQGRFFSVPTKYESLKVEVGLNPAEGDKYMFAACQFVKYRTRRQGH